MFSSLNKSMYNTWQNSKIQLTYMMTFQVCETPIQSCSKTRGLPGLPPLPSTDSHPSDLYQVTFRPDMDVKWDYSEYPSLSFRLILSNYLSVMMFTVPHIRIE